MVHQRLQYQVHCLSFFKYFLNILCLHSLIRGDFIFYKLYAIVTFNEQKKLRKWISHHVMERGGFASFEYFIYFWITEFSFTRYSRWNSKILKLFELHHNLWLNFIFVSYITLAMRCSDNCISMTFNFI